MDGRIHGEAAMSGVRGANHRLLDHVHAGFKPKQHVQTSDREGDCAPPPSLSLSLVNNYHLGRAHHTGKLVAEGEGG
jgi:hypothetical protein